MVRVETDMPAQMGHVRFTPDPESHRAYRPAGSYSDIMHAPAIDQRKTRPIARRVSSWPGAYLHLLILDRLRGHGGGDDLVVVGNGTAPEHLFREGAHYMFVRSQ